MQKATTIIIIIIFYFFIFLFVFVILVDIPQPVRTQLYRIASREIITGSASMAARNLDHTNPQLYSPGDIPQSAFGLRTLVLICYG
jgi:hypothetical protein